VSIPQPRIQKILEGVAKNGRVAGAYLFLGPPGVGKRAAADSFADLLGCNKLDKFVIEPGGLSAGALGGSIKIDQVRDLQRAVCYGPSASPYLLVIVEKADTLTDQAAAAFLKTLEEPAPGVVFALLAEREDRIPETIISRCQKIVFSEKKEGWKPDPSFNPFYDGLRNIRQKGVVERFKLASGLEKEKEKLEALLYDLAYFAWHELRDVRCARIIIDTLRYIKRRASAKLALDVMCLQIGGANAG
jgi:DNA polymerase III delta prime subunit